MPGSKSSVMRKFFINKKEHDAMKTIVACLALSATFAANADALSYSFENNLHDWTGGDIATETVTPPTYGWPIAYIAHEHVCSIAEEASHDGFGSYSTFDMIVKVVIPEDTPTSIDSDALLGIAVDANGYFIAWDGTAWTSPLGSAYESNDWVRLTVILDKTAKTYTVAIDGVLTGDTYAFNKNVTETTSVSKVTIMGKGTGLDDFVAREDTSFDPYAAVTYAGKVATVTATDEIKVPLNYLSKYGLESSNVDSPIENSSPAMKVYEAYIAGVAPTNGTAFAISEIDFSTSPCKIAFNGMWDASSYTIKYSTDMNTWKDVEDVEFSGAIGSEKNTAEFACPEGEPMFIKVVR